MGMAESLVLTGLDVVIASGAGQSLRDEGTLTAQGDGIAWCLLAERVAEHWPRPLRRFRYATMGARTVQWLSSQPTLPSAVVLYSGYTPYLQRLLPWCRRNGVRLLFDAVEWYEAGTWLGLPDLALPMEHRMGDAPSGAANRRRHRHQQLSGGLLSKARPAVGHRAAHDQRDRRRAMAAGRAPCALCYAGNPGNKDDLALVLRAVARLVSTGAAIHLTVAGPERSRCWACWANRPGASCRGCMRQACWSHADVQRLVGSVDFSILVRQPCRVSQAGFPDQVRGEPRLGDTVIANLTSDLHLYLRDGETGLVCGTPGMEGVASALVRATSLGRPPCAACGPPASSRRRPGSIQASMSSAAPPGSRRAAWLD